MYHSSVFLETINLYLALGLQFLTLITCKYHLLPLQPSLEVTTKFRSTYGLNIFLSLQDLHFEFLLQYIHDEEKDI